MLAHDIQPWLPYRDFLCLASVRQQDKAEYEIWTVVKAIIATLATASKSSLVFVVGEAIGQLKWIWL